VRQIGCGGICGPADARAHATPVSLRSTVRGCRPP
jgi:hypothetical protein